MPPATLQKNDAKYDVIKFILSVMVIAIHSVLYPMVLYPWLRIAVPLFFMMSSYFLFSKLRDSSAEEQKRTLKKFVIRNLQLYACWFVILLPITLYIRKGLYFSHGILENIIAVVKSFLFGSTFVASWYIMATVIGVLIVYYLSRLLRNNFVTFLIVLAAFCLVALSSSYETVIENTWIDAGIRGYRRIFSSLSSSYPTSLFWIFIGKMVAEQKLKLKSWVLFALVALSAAALYLEWRFVISLDGSNNNDSYFMLAPLCVFLFLSIQKIKPIQWKYSVYFKRASTVIYVAHGSILPVVKKLQEILLHKKIPLVSFLITFVCCMGIYGIIELAICICHKRKICKVLKMLY